MEQYFWGYGVIRKNNFSMAHLNVDTIHIGYLAEGALLSFLYV